MEMRTIVVSSTVLKKIERLRRQMGNPPKDDIIVRCLTVGLQLLEKELVGE